MSNNYKRSNEYDFNIPEGFIEKFDRSEFYRIIRDNKKIYAKTTFNRAIPYYKDGLIEGYRRGLYSMLENGVRSNKKTVKSATIVGNIIGQYHPHGDQAAYQSLVTLSQPWTNNYPLIHGQGNWGDVLGDPAAHMRYTECKLSEFFDDVCEDIKEEYVDFIPNYDNSKLEVAYLPFKIPVILLNGSYGIADSYMTSILTHNLNDVVDICEKYINNKSIRNEVLVDGFYPDCPNYGVITNKSEIEKTYKFNIPGNMKMKANMDIDRENNTIFIRDLPYGMTEADVLNTIKTYVSKQHPVLSKILNIVDVKTKRDGQMHIEYEVIFDKNSNILEIARDLEKYCLTKTIPISNIYCDKEYVKRVSIKDIIVDWYNTLYTTKLRKISYHQSLLSTNIHILEGKYKIYDYIDPILEFVKTLKDEKQFVDYLISKYELTPIQANAISNMKIHQLSKTSKEEILSQIEECKAKIAELDLKATKIDEEIIADLEKIKAKYGRPRRTILTDDNSDVNEITSIPMSNGMLLWTHNQYAIFDLNNIINGKTLMNGIKSVKVDGKNTKEIIGSHNITKDLIAILVFMIDGSAKRINVSEIVGVNNWISLSDDPIISAIIPIYSEDDKYIALSDTNKVKISTIETFGKQAVQAGNNRIVQNLDSTKDFCLFMNDCGRYQLIATNTIPELGRTAAGIMLELGDSSKISMIQIERFTDESGICSITDAEGYNYILKVDQDILEETNRVNKPKKLFDISNDFKFTSISMVDIKNKDYKCIMIGKNSTSQISMQNIRTSDIDKITKKVPIAIVGVISYKL